VLADFKDGSGLTVLGIKKTQVSASFINELNAALPNCKIEGDGAKRRSLRQPIIRQDTSPSDRIG